MSLLVRIISRGFHTSTARHSLLETGLAGIPRTAALSAAESSLNYTRLAEKKGVLRQVETWDKSPLAHSIFIGAGHDEDDTLASAAHISRVNTPVISVLEGDVSGRALSVPLQAPFVVATDSARVQLTPETLLIGKVAQRIGSPQIVRYLATAAPVLSAEDAYWLGIVTHLVPSWSIAQIHQQVSELHGNKRLGKNSKYVHAQIDTILNDAAVSGLAHSAYSGALLETIEKVFSVHDMRDVLLFLSRAPLLDVVKYVLPGVSADEIKSALAAGEMHPAIAQVQAIRYWAIATLAQIDAASSTYGKDLIASVQSRIKPGKAEKGRPYKLSAFIDAEAAALGQKPPVAPAAESVLPRRNYGLITAGELASLYRRIKKGKGADGDGKVPLEDLLAQAFRAKVGHAAKCSDILARKAHVDHGLVHFT